jgi:hypothetical protein
VYFQGRTSSHLFQLHYWLTWKYAATFGTMFPPSQYKCSIWLSAHGGKFDVQPYQPTTSTLCDWCVAIIQFYNLAFQPSSSKWLRVFSSVGTREKPGSSDTVRFWGVWFFHLWLNVLCGMTLFYQLNFHLTITFQQSLSLKQVSLSKL